MHNLRRYVQECVLPAMRIPSTAQQLPPAGHKSHRNTLSVRPERWRRLEGIYSMNDEALEDHIRTWTDTYVTEEPQEDIFSATTGQEMTLPCPSMFEVEPIKLTQPNDMSRVIPWIDALPLLTVQRIIHVVYPHLNNWSFNLVPRSHDERDQELFRYFVWRSNANNGNESAPSIIIAFQPPWILSEQDFKEFAKSKGFPPFLAPGNAFPVGLTAKDRLWAKLWDTCVSEGTRWFVLTSYSHWIFGGFSSGWTSAFISSAYDYDSYNPSIAECLAFWVVSSMDIYGGCSIPKVGDETKHVFFEAPCTAYELLDTIYVPEPLHYVMTFPEIHIPAEVPQPEDSESNWDGKSDEYGTSAGVFSDLSLLWDSASIEGVTTPLHHNHLERDYISDWVHDTEAEALNPDNPTIAAGARTYLNDHNPILPTTGEWLIMR